MKVRPFAVATVLVLVPLASGCSAFAGAPTTATTSASNSVASPSTTSPSSTTTASAAAAPSNSTGAAAAGAAPAWAKPVTTPGSKIATTKVGDITVDIYQASTATAQKQGLFVDPDTNKPIIAKGDPIVFVNYVVTNSGATVNLSNLLVDIEPRYDDWKYLQGMDTITDDSLFAAAQVNSDAFKPASGMDPFFTFAQGQTFSYGTNFKYQKGSSITFDVKLIPADTTGKLLSDKTIDTQAHATIS